MRTLERLSAFLGVFFSSIRYGRQDRIWRSSKDVVRKFYMLFYLLSSSLRYREIQNHQSFHTLMSISPSTELSYYREIYIRPSPRYRFSPSLQISHLAPPPLNDNIQLIPPVLLHNSKPLGYASISEHRRSVRLPIYTTHTHTRTHTRSYPRRSCVNPRRAMPFSEVLAPLDEFRLSRIRSVVSAKSICAFLIHPFSMSSWSR